MSGGGLAEQVDGAWVGIKKTYPRLTAEDAEDRRGERGQVGGGVGYYLK